MTPVPGPPRSWSFYKWAAIIAVIFGLQAGLILWLAARRPPPPVPVRPGLAIAGAVDPFAEIPGAINPNLQPATQPGAFPGGVSFDDSEVTNVPADWSGQPKALLLRPLKPLDADLTNAPRASLSTAVSFVARPQPHSDLMNIFPPADAAAESTFTLQGPLAARTLLSPPKLRSFSWDQALSNSLVQIDVDAEGRVCDPPVLEPGGSSGLPEADDYALSVAQQLRFQPLPGAGARSTPGSPPSLTWGTLAIHWLTLPPPPPAAPNP
jgi:hypothetical protein